MTRLPAKFPFWVVETERKGRRFIDKLTARLSFPGIPASKRQKIVVFTKVVCILIISFFSLPPKQIIPIPIPTISCLLLWVFSVFRVGSEASLNTPFPSPLFVLSFQKDMIFDKAPMQSNLDCFLRRTTPVVESQFLPKVRFFYPFDLKFLIQFPLYLLLIVSLCVCVCVWIV